jgi:hypothetical protein
MTCRTRFAPSPTGFLHIGGARTALYCWLEARRRGGKFILRIEDTDRERSTQAAIDAILEAMDWLGMDYDEGPIYQTERLERYRQVAEEMVAAGTAYYAYESKDEVARCRRPRSPPKEKPRYNGYYRERNEPRREDPNRVIRFKNPDRRHGGVRRPDQGPHRVEQRRARRHGDPALRRLADLQLRGRDRRPRHGRDRSDPRRRPRQQHAAADQHLQGARADRARLRAHADDPRSRGREAEQAPWRRPTSCSTSATATCRTRW